MAQPLTDRTLRSLMLAVALLACTAVLGERRAFTQAATAAVSLRSAAQERGFLIGATIRDIRDTTTWEPYSVVLAREFNYVTIFPNMQGVETERGKFSFAVRDAQVAWAKAHDLKVLFTPLVWDKLGGLAVPLGPNKSPDTPAWLKFNQPDCGGWSPSELDQIMKEWIQTYVSHYKGSATAYVVVNEPFKRTREPGGTLPLTERDLKPGPYTLDDLKDSCWKKILGEDYIAKAFTYAHEADPDALLIINDSFTSIRGSDRVMQDKFMELVRRLKAQGVPIHAVGNQMHLDGGTNRAGLPGIPPTYLDDFQDMLQKARDIGVQVHVTEMDVYIPQGSSPDPAQKQKDIYKGVLSTCLRFPNCTALTIFGITDKYGGESQVAHPDAAPLLFDANYQPKPAYFGVLEALTAFSVNPRALQFAASKDGAAGAIQQVTPSQVVSVSVPAAGTSWTASADQPWVQILSGSGSASGRFTVSIVNPDNVIGGRTVLTATITVTAIQSIRIPVTLVVRAPVSTTAPFGSFDTPLDGSAQGSIGVTGWALDDIGVKRVEIWRDPAAGEPTLPFPGQPYNGKVFIAEALFVNGARPDVEAAYPTLPLNTRGGWGYLLLTWGLPGQGNGTYPLYAYAIDAEDHVALLGVKTIVVRNATATRPFGSIDTPGSGATVSGTFYSFGWALTPTANTADSRTCTITNGNVLVSVDSGPLQPVIYGDRRTDIAANFPGFTNADGASGAYLLNTTTLANGVHTIGWQVTDSCGRSEGVGSRFFTVQNGSSVTATPPALTASSTPTAVSWAPIAARLGDGPREWPAPTVDGTRIVAIAQDGRLEVQLPTTGGSYDGYQLVNGERRALPPGSSLDAQAGLFAWQPAPGFLGRFDLAFAAGDERIPIRVVVGLPLRMSIDSPAARAVVSQPFMIAGWALDLAASDAAGIDAVHAWAFPTSGGQPIFVGVASLGDARPDVAVTYGAQFERSSYRLIAQGLPPDTYDVVVYVRRAASGAFDGAQTVRLAVR